MHFFRYKNHALYAEDLEVSKIAKAVGTPLYIYSYETIKRHIEAFQNAFQPTPHLLCFALKANPNSSILRIISKLGGGADIVSGGELYRSLKAGIQSNKIVYAGVGKTEAEIRYALNSKILMFNVESSDELEFINEIAGQMNLKAPVALRVNPDIDPQTHPYISTGLKENKFGIPITEAIEFYHLAQELQHIEIMGIHKHIGSQITKLSPFVDAFKKVVELYDLLQKNNIAIPYIDMGGGLGISYHEETPPEPRELAQHILPVINGRPFTLILEPGRAIVGNAGIFVAKTLYRKKTAEKEFVIVDAGMNDLLRPSLYNAYHHIQPVIDKERKLIVSDIVGPICESGDFLAKNRLIKSPEKGELLAVMSAGAYGFSMSSNYNSRPKVAEVLVRGNEYFVITERETYDDLIRKERMPEFLT
jgi:diaminopimelate decarboxylase